MENFKEKLFSWFRRIISFESILNVVQHFVSQTFRLISENVKLVHYIVEVFLVKCVVNSGLQRVEDVWSAGLGVGFNNLIEGEIIINLMI